MKNESGDQSPRKHSQIIEVPTTWPWRERIKQLSDGQKFDAGIRAEKTTDSKSYQARSTAESCTLISQGRAMNYVHAKLCLVFAIVPAGQ